MGHILGYKPTDLNVHPTPPPPPPPKCQGWAHSFVYVSSVPKKCPQRKVCTFCLF